MIRRLFILILILSSTSTLFSQIVLDFEGLTIDDGFTGSRANTIIQDQKGFIWIGTWNGLNKYDGYESDIYSPMYHDTNTISNREVLELLEDHNGNIWIGTTTGLNRLNPQTKELRQYDFQYRILTLYEDENNYIWAGTWNGGLFKLDPATGEKEQFLSSDIISDIFIDSRNIFWLASYYGLINFDKNSAGYIRYLPNDNNPASIGNSTVTQIVESKDKALWIGTWGGGLNKVIIPQNRDSIKFIHYRPDQREGSISSHVVYRLFYDKFDNLWAGTWDGGLNLLEESQQKLPPDSAIFFTYKNDLSDPFSISGNNITSLFVDRSGMLWVGSSKIDRANILKTGISRIKPSHTENGEYVKSLVRSFEQYEDHLWVGTSNEINLYSYSPEKEKLIKTIDRISYRHNNSNYLSNSIMSIIEDKKDLWVGTEDAGLVMFEKPLSGDNPKTEYKYFNTQTTPALPGNKVSNLLKSKKYPGTIWIGTMQNGFAKLTDHNGEYSIQVFPTGYHDKAITDRNIRTIVEDKDGLVWIGTQNGLNCLDPKTNNVTHYFYKRNDIQTLNDNVVNVLYEDNSGDLWVGTNTGINKKLTEKLDDGSEHTYFKGFPTVDYLNNEIITNIVEDDSSHLWIGVYRGMIKFNDETETIENIYFNKEFQHLIVERNSSTKANDGRFIIGGTNGFILFHPDSLYKFSPPPKVCITDLLISNESTKNKECIVDSTNSPVSISYARSIKLSHRDKILTFVFSAMDYKDPRKNQYAYLLEGFDEGWNEIGNRNSATYTKIRPGEYTFKVKAANTDGIWSEEPTTLEIKITPPFWKTKVAFIFYLLIFIGLMYFFNQYSIIEVKEKGRIQLEHMNYEKEHELNEIKSTFFTNITHEFRTPLTLILGPAEELTNSKELSENGEKQVKLIKRNAEKLLRLVNQLMEFRKVEKDKMELLPQKTDVVPMLNDLYESFQSIADTKGIELNMTIQKKELWAVIDREKIEKVMFNLMSNAFKFTEEGGKIDIRTSIESEKENNDILVLEVEDTGIGIKEEHTELVFERFFQVHKKITQSMGGIGLFLCKTFVELHGGTIELDSEPGVGSCFRVQIPVNREGYESAENNTSSNTGKEKIPDLDPLAQPLILSTENDLSNNESQVLIVEDDKELNEFIVSGLSNNFKVRGTYNGREGLEFARKNTPDLIITDIMMPEMDGIELCKILRKDLNTSHIPVIFLTAKTMKEDEILGLKIGAVDYIYKPFNLVTLNLKIQNILDNRKNIQKRIRTNNLMEPESIELSSIDEEFIKNAVDAVNDNLDDSTFDVEKFSHVIGISSNQAYRKIKALTGQTAKEFIRNQRLKTAASMLLQKKRSISEIIYMVGFSSPSYFTRCFREYYGTTPKEYIEKDGQV